MQVNMSTRMSSTTLKLRKALYAFRRKNTLSKYGHAHLNILSVLKMCNTVLGKIAEHAHAHKICGLLSAER